MNKEKGVRTIFLLWRSYWKIVLTPFLWLPLAALAQISYPHGYRQWTHVKSMQIKPGHTLSPAFTGIHHIYANKQALAGMRRGKFAKGATLVMDLLETREDASTLSEGPRRMVAVMHKDPEKYKATGGWGFEAFKADSRKERLVGSDAARACFQCHATQQKTDYVFSSFRP
jgi:hypothetical protein